MIFVGDIAIPFAKAISLENVPEELLNKKWFGNLEGAIIQNAIEQQNKAVVFNGQDAIEELIDKFNFSGFALANNHILDTGSYKQTTDFLKQKSISFCGIGEGMYEAALPIFIKEGDNEVIILNFGWEVIQCEVTDGNQIGVNPLRRGHVLKIIKTLIDKYPNAKIIPFMHWGYELESEPQPFERELAKKLIDIGVAGVIGCHPHRIGGFELYNGKPIVYSLGNWLFKQNYFHNGKIKFPDFCNQELAFEWDFDTNQINFHFFDYESINSNLTYTYTEDVNSKTMLKFTPFNNLSENHYKKWYKQNHYHKRKGLPIYYWEDTNLVIKLKNMFNKLRDKAIALLIRLK